MCRWGRARACSAGLFCWPLLVFRFLAVSRLCLFAVVCFGLGVGLWLPLAGLLRVWPVFFSVVDSVCLLLVVRFAFGYSWLGSGRVWWLGFFFRSVWARCLFSLACCWFFLVGPVPFMGSLLPEKRLVLSLFIKYRVVVCSLTWLLFAAGCSVGSCPCGFRGRFLGDNCPFRALYGFGSFWYLDADLVGGC